MAVTKLWKIGSNLGRTIDYAEDKTKTNSNLKDLDNAIDYATNKDKTEEQFYTTGINCEVDTALKQMNQTKKMFNKTKSILGFHGYQSFKEGEVTPELAHDIGVKLANEMWGDRFEVVVTTHLNTKHLHNHFIVNSVSFVDGMRFYSNRSSTARLREISDSLCKEYGLSVLDEKAAPKGRIYFPYYLKNTNRNNYYAKTRNDIDIAIGKSSNYDEFIKILTSMNYEVQNRYGKLSVRNLSYKRNIRIERYFGEEYSIDNIKSRILEEEYIEDVSEFENKFYKNKSNRKYHGIVALYRYYCYLLKIYPNKKYRSNNFIKDDVIKLEKYNTIIRMFDRENITDDETFRKYENMINDKYDQLVNDRKKLRKQYFNINNEQEKIRILNKIKDINKELPKLKNEINLCSEINIESKKIKSTVDSINDNQKTKERDE